jgi:hypothetical protein
MTGARIVGRLLPIVLAAALPALAMAGKNTPHDPQRFVAYASSARFEVPDDMTYSERRGIGVLLEQGVRAGRYVARSQDGDGYYFFGEGPTVCQANPTCKTFDLEGGIWVSKKDSTDVRIFLVQPPPKPPQPGTPASGILALALAKKDVGKIFIFPPNKPFAARLAPLKTE